MKELRTSVGMNVILFSVFVTVFGCAFVRTYLRIQTTLMGYEIGRLKSQESDLLQERAHLQMNYAKLTTKAHLSLLSDEDRTTSSKRTPSRVAKHDAPH